MKLTMSGNSSNIEKFDVNQNQKVNVMFILEWNNNKVWAKLNLPVTFNDFVLKAHEIFPILNNLNFFFVDSNDARLDAILVDYVLASPNGVILKIKCADTQIQELDEAVDYELPITPHSLSVVEIAGTSSSNDSISNLIGEDSQSIPAKKPKLESDQLPRVLTKKKLEKLILDTPNGSDLIKEYHKQVVSHLKCHKDKVQRSLHAWEKAECAKAIVELFPSSRNNKGVLGYEHFFDPKSGKGFLATSLSNKSRKKKSSLTPEHLLTTSDSGLALKNTSVNETSDIKADIDFMKTATPKEKNLIIEKSISTFNVRRDLYLNENFFREFPRFLDTPELIDVEFKLIFPEIDLSSFKNSYPQKIDAILKIFKTEKFDETLLEWDHDTNSIIALTQLLPPTARGKKGASRGKAKGVVDKLIIFKPIGSPIQSVYEEPSRQPKLIAVGSSKLSVTQFFLRIDNHHISLNLSNILEAIDFLFKAYYVFNVEFDPDLLNFWIFIQNFLYGISSKCTNKVQDFYTKLEAS
ncbi:uncharacterized protein LOC130672839 [Microplitis mediator]|uniref:uncharacterized protein LOC130672839 n=1 Tax=Microplitis mediator TaxID=375433 RepID=UPI0025543C25|nr:uncharacterized protein LOC130672839 [Microplitis mediator]